MVPRPVLVAAVKAAGLVETLQGAGPTYHVVTGVLMPNEAKS